MKSLIRVALVTASLLLIPLVGGWPWGLGDFVAMGILIFGTGMALDYVATKVDKKHRVLVGVGVLGVFFLIWTEMAVGLVTQLLSGELWIFDFLK